MQTIYYPLTAGGGADLAEYINVSEPSDLVELDPAKVRHYRKARGNSERVGEVIASEPGFILDNNLKSKAGSHPLLALMGWVPVKATTENGPINPGDLLTVSNRPGYAARFVKTKRREGVTIGKPWAA